jgi:hypothetical protein
VTPDLAVLAARFCDALRAQGIAVGADRAARFAHAILLVAPETTPELYRCALATLVSTPDEIAIVTRVFAAVFEDYADPADFRGDHPSLTSVPGMATAGTDATSESGREVEIATIGSAVERLAARDFGELDADELALL